MNNLLTTLLIMEKTYKIIVIILLLVTSIFSILSYIKISNVYIDGVYRDLSIIKWMLIDQEDSINYIKWEVDFLEYLNN